MQWKKLNKNPDFFGLFVSSWYDLLPADGMMQTQSCSDAAYSSTALWRFLWEVTALWELLLCFSTSWFGPVCDGHQSSTMGSSRYRKRDTHEEGRARQNGGCSPPADLGPADGRWQCKQWQSHIATLSLSCSGLGERFGRVKVGKLMGWVDKDRLVGKYWKARQPPTMGGKTRRIPWISEG